MFSSRNSLACFFLVFGLKSRARKKGMVEQEEARDEARQNRMKKNTVHCIFSVLNTSHSFAFVPCIHLENVLTQGA
jgi:hypothetical protein